MSNTYEERALSLPNEERVNLLGKTKDELREWVMSWDQPAYRAEQLFQWMYHRRVRDFVEMTNLPKSFRAELTARAEIEWCGLAARIPSRQDDTVKYLFALSGGEQVESVLMYDRDRVTVCISSQVGCAQGCTFCATAQMGLKRNMTTGEILSQLLRIEEEIGVGRITNVVFMGMGEPLANYTNVVHALRIMSASDGLSIAAKKTTVSTSGLVPAIQRFTREGLKAGLALSLNATTDDVRNELIPSNRRYGIQKVLGVCAEWTRTTGRRLTVEYVLLRGVNDSRADAGRLAQLLKQIPAKVNLIPFNDITDAVYSRPLPEQVEAFQDLLREAGYVTTVRNTKGGDIAAACGQLRTQFQQGLFKFEISERIS